MKVLLLNTAMAAARYGLSAKDTHVTRKIATIDGNGNLLDTSVSKETRNSSGKLIGMTFDFVSSPSIKAAKSMHRCIGNRIAIKQKKMLKVKVLPKDKAIISIKRKLLIKLLRRNNE